MYTKTDIIINISNERCLRGKEVFLYQKRWQLKIYKCNNINVVNFVFDNSDIMTYDRMTFGIKRS